MDTELYKKLKGNILDMRNAEGIADIEHLMAVTALNIAKAKQARAVDNVVDAIEALCLFLEGEALCK